ncbi:MAG: 3-oxoacyl-[acyl-carrier-protein] reductase [Candidatus Melainabacteria bacterium HGW-Melainabacteria-1]|nr:MAG: 3-oxoacyl-[acyl-carrier-protein] reductase [Candidatus Melainabacteria bacterium HGW-Melainabacteria-1]
MPHPAPQVELTGKVALVTGSSRGIGRACALRLAAAGADLVLNYHFNAEEAELVRQEAEALGVRVACLQADVSQAAQVDAMFAQIQAQFGRLDVLVNNAGITRDKLLLRMTQADWDDVMATNLRGLFNCTRPAVKMMLKQQSGRIVNIASVVGIVGNAGQCNYAASKAGVLGFTRSLALELAPRRIAVNAVAPGFIASEMTLSLSANARAEVLKKIPYGRLGECPEVAEVVLFLSSDRCQYLTGQTLNVDGGMVMH